MKFYQYVHSPYPTQESAVKEGVNFYHKYNKYPCYMDLIEHKYMPTGNRIRTLFGGIKVYRQAIYEMLGEGYPPPAIKSQIKETKFSCLNCGNFVCTKDLRICKKCKNTEAFQNEDYGYWMNASIVLECTLDVDEDPFD